MLAGGGCGSNRPETIPVRGRVVFNGHAPPASGMIYFAPVEPAEGFPRRPGRATFDNDGYFRATTFTNGDGLMPGRYRVCFDCWDRPPRPEGPPSQSFVPPPYDQPSTTPLELVVEPDAKGIDKEFNLSTAAITRAP